MSTAFRPPRPGGLWRNPDFLKLWGGQTISVFGSFVTGVALPLVAVLTLRANQTQVALLYAASATPALALGLVAGALVDRVRRRPLLIGADVGRGLALLAVPVAAALGGLSLGLLYAVSAVMSALTTLFDTAYPAYLATLVPDDALVEGNAKLASSVAVSEVAGFSAAGALAQALTAPVAVLIDAFTYVVSVVSLASIRAPEPRPRAEMESVKLWQVAREIGEGLRLTWIHPARRAITGAATIQALGGSLLETVLVIFVLRDLRLSATAMGLSFGAGGVAAFAGAAVMPRITARLGMARALRLSLWISRLLGLLMPLAGGPAWLALVLITVPQLGDAAYSIYEVAGLTTLQLVTPSGALGRVVASGATLRGAGSLIGLALGATLGASLGARGTLVVAMVGMLLAPLLLSLTPLGDPRLASHGQVSRNQTSAS